MAGVNISLVPSNMIENKCRAIVKNDFLRHLFKESTVLQYISLVNTNKSFKYIKTFPLFNRETMLIKLNLNIASLPLISIKRPNVLYCVYFVIKVLMGLIIPKKKRLKYRSYITPNTNKSGSFYQLSSGNLFLKEYLSINLTGEYVKR